MVRDGTCWGFVACSCIRYSNGTSDYVQYRIDSIPRLGLGEPHHHVHTPITPFRYKYNCGYRFKTIITTA